MARPRDNDLKQRIRGARHAGASIESLMADFQLSRNTIFYHLREDTAADGREKYTAAQKTALARMTDGELREEAQRLGKTFIALQRVAYRERKREETTGTEAARTRIELRGYLDFNMESELLLYGLDQERIRLANRRLTPYKLRLAPPNRLETTDGVKYCPMRLKFQQAIILDTIATLTAHAVKIKASWRMAGCPACGGMSLGLQGRADGSTYRVCSCGWSADTGKVVPREPEERHGYRSRVE